MCKPTTNCSQRKSSNLDNGYTLKEIERLKNLPVVTIEEFLQMTDEERFVYIPLSELSDE